jgi:hypothetical protein
MMHSWGTKSEVEEPKNGTWMSILRKWKSFVGFEAVDFWSRSRCYGAASIEAADAGGGTEEGLMEDGLYLNASQRAIIAARMANPPEAAHKGHLPDASIDAPISQAEAARRLSVGRSSVQPAANLLKNAAPE